MKIGFTGTRNGMTDVQAAMFEGFLSRVEEFHHGGCCGADVEAARIVRKSTKGPVQIVCHPGPVGDSFQTDSGVDNVVLAPKSHFARNRTIVDGVDVLLACPFEQTEQKRGGTWYTIRYARKVNKPVVIIFPDGGLE